MVHVDAYFLYDVCYISLIFKSLKMWYNKQHQKGCVHENDIYVRLFERTQNKNFYIFMYDHHLSHAICDLLYVVFSYD